MSSSASNSMNLGERETQAVLRRRHPEPSKGSSKGRVVSKGLGAVRAKAPSRQEAAWWGRSLHSLSGWSLSPLGLARSPPPVQSRHVQPRMAQDQRRVELPGDVGQKNPGLEVRERLPEEGRASGL